MGMFNQLKRCHVFYTVDDGPIKTIVVLATDIFSAYIVAEEEIAEIYPAYFDVKIIGVHKE